MKVLVATAETQGQRTGDVFEADEGELVRPNGQCDREACDCQSVMCGLLSGKPTTTMRVVERPGFTRDDLYKLVLQAAIADEMLVGNEAEDDEFVSDVVAHLMRLVADFPPGSVVEKVGYHLELRRTMRPRHHRPPRKHAQGRKA